jgi:hypothetical protein
VPGIEEVVVSVFQGVDGSPRRKPLALETGGGRFDPTRPPQ